MHHCSRGLCEFKINRIDLPNSYKPSRTMALVWSRTQMVSASILAQWLVANQLFNATTNTTSINNYLNGPNGVHSKDRGVCVGTTASGTTITYIRVYKSGKRMICHALRELTGHPRRAINVTFVRDPLSHFVAGFTEIVHRVPSLSHHYPSPPYTFVRYLKINATLAAMAFVRDFVTGKMNRFRDVTDAHSFPQIAFLRPYLPHRIQFIGTMHANGFEPSWAEMNRLANSTLKIGPNVGHDQTNAKSNNRFRRAMEALLYNGFNLYKEAVCRVLLVDYVCFSFTLPAGCKEAIGSHQVHCPVKALRRYV